MATTHIEEADAQVVLRMPNLPIHCREIKAQLPQMLGPKLARLQFDHNVAAQLEVVEQ